MPGSTLTRETRTRSVTRSTLTRGSRTRRYKDAHIDRHLSPMSTEAEPRREKYLFKRVSVRSGAERETHA